MISDNLQDKPKIQIKKWASNWIILSYILGLSLWGIIAFIGYRYGHDRYLYNWWFLAPILLTPVILLLNLWIWRKPRTRSKYIDEVAVIEFVERNAGYLILAVTAVIIAAQILSDSHEINPVFLRYILVSLIFLTAGILPLVWIPAQNVDGLVLLRHIKTISYTYGISLFIAGMIALLT